MQGSSNVSGLHVPHQCLGLMGKAAEHEDHSPHQGPSDDGKRGDDDHHFIVFIALPVHIQPSETSQAKPFPESVHVAVEPPF